MCTVRVIGTCQRPESIRRSASRIYHFHTDLVGASLEVTGEAGELAWEGKSQ
ncbi:hypothetical protein FCJ61_35510 [Burkholderia metallica]|uniref:RHS domain-containing protein n=1 Tax=Burkholderia metallica TaxID=488729 RepID=UPI00157BA432|nr:RHS domain-containing protein [Burkholderia metallica]NTZ88156.1 hypothetical protein [Burkholderia metallica]